ncbi:MAG: MarR family transcriptional regulator [Bacillota bacterium]|nr:MarR family transcriptional regulator [Bacillota bacterium]
MEQEAIQNFREALRRLQRELSWQSRSDAACCGITIAQCYALSEIGKHKDISLVDLVAILGLDASTLSRTIENMVQADLVRRQPDLKDRRYLKITLTEQGKAVFDEINRTSNTYYSKILAALPPGKQNQVMESINLLTRAVSGADNGAYCREE